MNETAIDAELAHMELSDLWGVARRLAARLTALGITSPLALKQSDPRFIRERFNVVLERLVLELRGIACMSLEEAPPDRKSIMASRSFGRTVESREELEEAVAAYTSRAAEKLRGQGLAAGRITVFAHTNRFRPDEPQYEGVQPVDAPRRNIRHRQADRGRAARAWRALPPRLSLQESRHPAARAGAGRTRCRAACSMPPTRRHRKRACARSIRSTGALAVTR